MTKISNKSKLSPQQLAAIEYAMLPHRARYALEFWHERVGKKLGEKLPGDAMTGVWETWKQPKDDAPIKLSAKPKAEPVDHAGRTLFKRRLGAGVNAVVMIDEKDAVLVERLSESAAAVWREAGFRIYEPDAEKHLMSGVFNWLASPERVGRCLVVKFGKASALATLEMCRPPFSSIVCEPDGAGHFDIRSVLKAKDLIASGSKELREGWVYHCTLLAKRARLISGLGAGVVETQINNLNKMIHPLELLTPPGLVIPVVGTFEAEMLRVSLVENTFELRLSP